MNVTTHWWCHEKPIKEHNPNWPQISDHPYRVLIIESPGCGKTNSSHQADIDKIYLYTKDPYEAKYQLLIKKRKTTGFPANIRLDEDVLKTSFVFVFRGRRLDQNEYIRSSQMSSEYVLKTSSRQLDQDQYFRFGHTSSRPLQDVLPRRLQDIFPLVIRLQNTSWRRLQDVLIMINIFVLVIHLQNVFKTSCKNVFKTSSIELQDVLQRCPSFSGSLHRRFLNLVKRLQMSFFCRNT